MKNKNTQIFVCAIGESRAKHYLAVGTTKLQPEDLESQFTEAPTPAIVKALGGLTPVQLIWVELEWIAEKTFLAKGRCVTADGVQHLEPCRMHAREMYIGQLADILVDETRRELK